MKSTAAQSVFSRGLTDGSHTRRFDVERVPNEGWRIRDQRDAEVIRHVTCEDWHRAELAIRGFTVEAFQLTQRGWRIFH